MFTFPLQSPRASKEFQLLPHIQCPLGPWNRWPLYKVSSKGSSFKKKHPKAGLLPRKLRRGHIHAWVHMCASSVVHTHSHTGGQDRPQSKSPCILPRACAKLRSPFLFQNLAHWSRPDSQKNETLSQAQPLPTQSALQVGSWQLPLLALAGRGVLLCPGVNRHKEPA